ncbi:CDP-alcohol phosphatidyltransferase family protein [uncultured Tateyamaria sp.]|uniref:CDP-alcohol phosphatidyltransferase family protein n=1 Tax=uncultured Tateyamaria sp. TaxID=455651 RepID=UPI0026262C15|nr:CDP-alcohol phosphatidyltransferase family protein [uncultured Tateyamaria sp.]
MFRSTPHLVAQTAQSRTPLGGFLGVAAVLAVLLAFAAFHLLDAAITPLVLFSGIVTIAGYGLVQSYVHPVLGLCNAVTLLRAAMLAFLAGAVFAPHLSVWVVCAVATTAFALDGVDGWLARRADLVSDFGARFDMEVDAGLGAVISLWLLMSGTTGPEILILGFMRYAFVAASFVWPALQAPLPPSFRRKAICVVQIAALILLIFPLTPTVMVVPVGILAAVLLSWSFLADVLWLTTRRTA